MTSSLLFLLAIAAPLAAAPALALLGRRYPEGLGRLCAAVALFSTACLVALGLRSDFAAPLVVDIPWVPSLGVSLSFLVDGLSLFFGLVVSGMGVFIAAYANEYLRGHYPRQGRFYAYLMAFMAAMLGTVFANDLIVLFVFWEATGIASFMLIGFSHEKESARLAARMSLIVTSATALLLLAGILLIGLQAGTYRLDALLAAPRGSAWILSPVALVLVMAGAFGKSAQFPLHFWLPNAMAAPTPVSAYLHSATMVKLGVFLCARVYPLFVDLELWTPLLTVVGFSTMLLGAGLAVLSHDMKAVLAYATVSQLGFFIGYYGLGDVAGVRHDLWHIFTHVLYKAPLFMVAGIVEHATGTRDLRKLGGLLRRMPLVAFTAALALASMAGVPGVPGFISKEAMLHEVVRLAERDALAGWASLAVVLLASALKVVFSLRFFTATFLGPAREAASAHRPPSFALTAPPLVLATAALLVGLFPALVDDALRVLFVPGLHDRGGEPLALWHGVNVELGLSALVLGLGSAAFALGHRTRFRWARVPRLLRFDEAFERGYDGLAQLCKRATTLLRFDAPLDYLPIVVSFAVLLIAGFVISEASTLERLLAESSIAESASSLRALTAILISIAIFGVVFLPHWTAQLVSLSIAGFLITFYFVLYRAPDLAMTQLLIEVATLVLLLVLLNRFQRAAQRGTERDTPLSARRLFSLVLAVMGGAGMTGSVLLVTAAPHPDPVGPLYLEQTFPLAGGTNAVNTILVDFRGMDTLGEITVLTVAVLGALGLLMRYKRTPEERARGPLGPPGFGIHHEEGKDADRT